MKAFGAALKNAREESGITLEEVHERSRINLKHLRAIESGDFPSVPQTYVRAFIREYARIVGLDENETVRQYNQLAEELKGIPQPPEAIDHSHLTPQIDDSVEIVEKPYTPVTPRHVEVEGKPEVDEEEYTPSIKRSKYVSDDHKVVDLPKAAPAAPPVQPQPAQQQQKRSSKKKGQKKKANASSPKPGGENTASAPQQQPASTQKQTPVVPPPVQPPAEQPTVDNREDAKRLAALKQEEFEAQLAKARSEKKAAEPKRVQKEKTAEKPVKEKPQPKEKKPPKKRTAEEEEERRLMIIGSLIILAVAVGIYGIWFFSTESTPSTAVTDSTAVQPSVYADRFIDSTDFIPDEPEIIPDTTTGAALPQQDAQNAKDNIYSRDDSLVLEAFSSTPVYFSIRMDTTKTEKGFLSSNEHRMWKAKDQFVISLGDAGAMTFFLNGRQLKALGGEGLAINNHVINRRTLDQE